jgi:Fic family protein
MDDRLQVALSAADRALARLDGATLTLPDPDLFVYAFMRQEAVLSSQIEGTQASLDDLFEYEAAISSPDRDEDIEEVVNYIRAMNWALDELDRLPISIRLIKGLHKQLLRSGRGSARAPGDLRDNQNWLGPEGCTIEQASFVPPAVPLMHEALYDLEKFIHDEKSLPPLIKYALIHSQFETIHPFWDGNGRIGRMLVTLLLCSDKILIKPVLYLSLFFKQNRQAYYDTLQATRDKGEIEDWVLFFLNGVEASSKSALSSARAILSLREHITERLPKITGNRHAHTLLHVMYRQPYITTNAAKEFISSSYPTANTLIGELVEGGILTEVTGRSRGRVYAFRPYLDILHKSVESLTGILDGNDHLATRQ